MAIKTMTHPMFVVDNFSELSSITLTDAMVYCKATEKFYVNSSGTTKIEWGAGHFGSEGEWQMADVTTWNATISAHGFLKKLDGTTTNFMRGDGTWAVPAASVAIYQTEVDFGSVPLKMKKFTIIDAGVTASMKIIPTLSYDNPSDGELDSAEWFEDLTLTARADTGQFFLYCNSPYQDLTGKVKVNYIYA